MISHCVCRFAHGFMTVKANNRQLTHAAALTYDLRVEVFLVERRHRTWEVRFVPLILVSRWTRFCDRGGSKSDAAGLSESNKVVSTTCWRYLSVGPLFCCLTSWRDSIHSRADFMKPVTRSDRIRFGRRFESGGLAGVLNPVEPEF